MSFLKTVIDGLIHFLGFFIPRYWAADLENNRWRRWNGHAFEYREMTANERDDALASWEIR
ncbi:hypothetical protein QV13_12820 [Mesorhizobium hungaricum]|jgi:hypothetical protein|uniref:Uncharacterized protein n=1 Tax=Mesorhizobium hungaricum TaxID=1566387 RepID=A0A1C2DS72_9HYPH|nr:hypothetical protein QV13_12820 [Mesorhizobium hungaricum]